MLSASLVSADLGNLAQEIRRLEQAGVHRLHIDVEDGVFVPNLTFGFPVLRAVRRLTQLPLEVHLMMADPEPYLERFAELGADLIAVHLEACPYPRRTLARIRALGKQAYLAVNPRTPVSGLAYLSDLLDGVLLLSSEPDLAGERFLPATYRRVEQVWGELGRDVAVTVDGGVGAGEAPALWRVGVSALVVGRALCGAPDLEQAVQAMCGEPCDCGEPSS